MPRLNLTKLFVVTLLALLAGPAIAQHHRRISTDTRRTRDLHQRAIKALGEEQIADLKAGRGMGLALAAELNGYPGPLHVLELKDQLQLTADQRQRFQQLYDSMKAEAIAAGEAVIESERLLDQQFAERTMTPEALAALTAQIGGCAGQAARGASQVSSHHRRPADRRPEAALRRTARLPLTRGRRHRRAGRPRSSRKPPCSGCSCSAATAPSADGWRSAWRACRSSS